ncbi:MAG: M28 family peptidase, partial [Acidobacteriota bacterium]
MPWKKLLVLTVAATAIRAAASFAQPVPFLTDEEYRHLVGEISGDAAYEHIRFATQFHRPRGGTPGLMEVARYFEARARAFGLSDVRLIRQKAPYPGWEARRAELWLVEPERERLASLVQTHLHLADYSRSADVTAELVDVGEGVAEEHYQGLDVKDKVVLAWGAADAVMGEAVGKRGALGLVLRPAPSSPQALYYPHQVRWSHLPHDVEKSTFAFVLSHAQGATLAARLGNTVQPLRVHAGVEAEFSEGWQVMVEGFIKGDEHTDQHVVLTGHLQEEKFSANDDASGCASTLEVARALAKLIGQGVLPRPRRHLRFWWVTEIGSERQFFADHPEEAKKLLVNINQDMVGANQGQDVMRVQNITRVPFSRFHFLNDVAEAVIDFVVRTNTAELAKAQAGTPQPYSRPILSHLGSRHRYNARMIPFHNSTDSMTFNETPIGVPAITFTNWPD